MGLFAILAIVFLVLWLQQKKKTKQFQDDASKMHMKYDVIEDAISEAHTIRESAKQDSQNIRAQADQEAAGYCYRLGGDEFCVLRDRVTGVHTPESLCRDLEQRCEAFQGLPEKMKFSRC